MKNENMKIEQRLQNMKDFYLKAGLIIDNLPDAVPNKIKAGLKEAILGDKDLKNFMEGIDKFRPPKIFLIGRTGVGKSSLINALCGVYVAKVSDTKSCTKYAQCYKCKSGDRDLMEIFDTRGIVEAEVLDKKTSAEKELINDIEAFLPDVAILVLNCIRRDGINSDVEFMVKVAKSYKKATKRDLPVVVVVNKCDEMAPAREKEASKYPENKLRKINEQVQYFKKIIMDNGLQVENIVPVSSLLDWQTPDGMEVAVEDIEVLPKYDRENLQICFDGRYNMDKLFDILEAAIFDFEAQMGLKMAAQLNDVIKRLAKHLNNLFSGIAGTVAATPIPIADIYILLGLQAVLVSLIASLSGRDISFETAKEFIFSMGGIAGAGFAFKIAAQQLAKLFPGAGTMISASIAAAGTSSMGKAAIAYYIEDKKITEVEKDFIGKKQEKNDTDIDI